MAYTDIAYWKGEQYIKGLHFLPWLRGQIDLSEKVSFVIGDIYGGANHNLILPLYEPELNFTADPEAGAQFLLGTSHFDLDIWINWESFIYRGDTHQEAFTFGVSGKMKWNKPNQRFEIYSPVQLLAQHRGGEIDTVYTNSVQTLMNGAVGLGVTYEVGNKYLKRINAEVDAVGYYQQAGHIWPFGKGFGAYASVVAEVSDFKVGLGYWKCHDFISMFGSPFFGAVSTSTSGATFRNPSTLNINVQYSKTFAKAYTFGAAVNFYQQFKTIKSFEGENSNVSPSNSFGASLFMRLCPSFILKQFKN
jgi:hypothetical protein